STARPAARAARSCSKSRAEPRLDSPNATARARSTRRATALAGERLRADVDVEHATVVELQVDADAEVVAPEVVEPERRAVEGARVDLARVGALSPGEAGVVGCGRERPRLAVLDVLHGAVGADLVTEDAKGAQCHRQVGG